MTYDAYAEALAYTVSNGGGTFEAFNMLPFTPLTGDGYAVAVGGIKLHAEFVDRDVFAMWVKAVAAEHEATFVGTWLNDGLLYIDAIEYVRDPGRAKALGRLTGQLSIYNFATNEVEWLVSEEAR